MTSTRCCAFICAAAFRVSVPSYTDKPYGLNRLFDSTVCPCLRWIFQTRGMVLRLMGEFPTFVPHITIFNQSPFRSFIGAGGQWVLRP